MPYIETDNTSYYFYKIMSFLFGVIFLTMSLSTLLEEDGIININDVPTTATFLNMIPFLIIGLVSLTIFIWICRNFFRAILTDYNVQKQLFRKNIKYSWDDFEYIEEVKWKWPMIIFKFKPKGENVFYIHADHPKIVPFYLFDTKRKSQHHYKTKMGDLIIKMKKYNAIQSSR